ncbi:MAG: hypothetical protein LAO23_18000 [Acidobacteriia bacterium]|nr:hypothetical protein [Terriglobia bacterium]
MWTWVLQSKTRQCVLYVFVVFLFSLFVSAQKSATGSRKQPSEQAQQRISKAVAANPDYVLVFDNEGNVEKSVKLTERDKTYESLERFVQFSKKSPVDSCKHPSPVPPPPCILCDNGEIVCSESKFKAREEMK